jgi:cobalt/nickel transport system permease protein
MHIPDGLISDPRVWIGADVVTVGVVGYAIRRESRDLKPERVPLMGLMAAFVFAGQLLNVPMGVPGVSGHLLGAVLAATLLGPWRATIVMAVVIAVQCLLYNDGGLTALGANILNMGIAGTLAGFGVYSGLRRLVAGRAGTLVAAGVGAWFSVVLGAALVAGQLALCSDILSRVGVGRLFALLVGLHIPIGLLEALITVGALAVVTQSRPDLLGLRPKPAASEAGEGATAS